MFPVLLPQVVVLGQHKLVKMASNETNRMQNIIIYIWGLLDKAAMIRIERSCTLHWNKPFDHTLSGIVVFGQEGEPMTEKWKSVGSMEILQPGAGQHYNIHWWDWPSVDVKPYNRRVGFEDGSQQLSE